jgi:hypothetical protein
VKRVLPIALAIGAFLCGPALAILPEPAGPAPSQAATECSALASAYERGHWDGWKKRSDAVGGGL